MKQLTLPKLPRNCKFFGGSLLYGRRKGQRPLPSNQAFHLVLKSQWAIGKDAFTRNSNRKAIENLISSIAQNYGVRVYRTAIVSNHIHIILRSKRRWLYRAFISVLTGQIAQHVMKQQSFKFFVFNKMKEFEGEGVQSYEKQHKDQKFWMHRPFSRILNWGRDYTGCMKYLTQNTLEAIGFIEYTPRRDYYANWRLKILPI